MSPIQQQPLEIHEQDVCRPDRSWGAKFGDAFRGMWLGFRGESSFFAHFFMTAAVVLAGVVLDVNMIEWCLLAICITTVLVTEMLNTALETMARAITDEPNPHIGGALDIGRAAVLLASLGAAIVGAIVLLNALGKLMGWV